MRFQGAKLALVALLCAACDDNGPGLETFTASMTGAAVRPTPVTTTATGTAAFTLSANGDTITYAISATGLSGTGAIAMHIHGPADTGGFANIAHGFTLTASTGALSAGSFTTVNTAMPFDSLLVLMRNGLAYVNLHTTANQGGEIRGQIRRQ